LIRGADTVLPFSGTTPPIVEPGYVFWLSRFATPNTPNISSLISNWQSGCKETWNIANTTNYSQVVFSSGYVTQPLGFRTNTKAWEALGSYPNGPTTFNITAFCYVAWYNIDGVTATFS